jgi:hypothetical protein
MLTPQTEILPDLDLAINGEFSRAINIDDLENAQRVVRSR